MATANHGFGDPRTLLLRVLIALYIVSAMLGLFDWPGLAPLLAVLLPFAHGWVLATMLIALAIRALVTGETLRPATLGLMGLVVAVRMAAPEAPFLSVLLHDGLLLMALSAAGGLVQPMVRFGSKGPRTRLVRKPAPPRPAPKAQDRFGPRGAFSQDGDELEALFDQIGEVPRG